MESQLPYQILPQPNETTCGPTCLHSVYRYYGDELPLERVINEVGALEEGGTLAVFLGCHALTRGYEATIYTFNLQVFDPTWFRKGAPPIEERLAAQRQIKQDPKLRIACDRYIEYVRLGGQIRMEVLNGNLIRKFLKRETPILTGLSSTFLYQEARERASDVASPGVRFVHDDVAGYPQGHFVVLCGYDPDERTVLVADPFVPNPIGADHVYPVELDRVIAAVLLGIITYDANLLVIRPRKPGLDRRPTAE
ncbi:MAG: hypothetical protein KDA75_09940 [Planctomycetaceae bacterium]|nr:hypothetical protein [Planctomycetaceae bacterium]